MIAGVADTPVWHLFNDARLSITAGDFIDEAARAGNRIVVSAVSLAEVVYLIEKGRLPESACAELIAALANPGHVLKEAPFTAGVVEAMRRVARAEVPDMPDRMVAGTAVYLNVPVISRDGRIRSSNVQTVW